MFHRFYELSDRDQRLFAADCAEHVLPVFERAYPQDTRPRKTIEAVRAFAYGTISRTQLVTAKAAANAAAKGVPPGSALDGVRGAARTASHAAKNKDAKAVWDTAVAARGVLGDLAFPVSRTTAKAAVAATLAGEEVERAWQESCLRWYLDPNRGSDWQAFGFGRGRFGSLSKC